jgi:hypothetical protein
VSPRVAHKANDKAAPAFRAACFSGKVWRPLSQDPVGSLARVALRRLHLQSHMLSELPAHEAADAVVLPVRGFRNLGEGCTFLTAYGSSRCRLAAAGGFFSRPSMGKMIGSSRAHLNHRFLF